MKREDAMVYKSFKEAVLKRLKITPESYCLKLRHLKKSDNITHVEYVHKLRSYVKKDRGGW